MALGTIVRLLDISTRFVFLISFVVSFE